MSQLHSNSASDSDAFVPIDPSRTQELLAILKGRLPKSGHVYNCVLRFSRSGRPSNERPEHSIYILNGDISLASWILVVHTATGFKNPQQVSISGPDNPQITDDIKQAFVRTKAINWDANMMMNAVDRPVSRMIADISWVIKGFVTTCYPNYYYTIEPEEAAKLEIPSLENDSVKVQPLDTTEGASFITDHWKYAASNTLVYSKEMVRRHPSAGVYVDGVPVSGVLTHGDLLIGMLATTPAHRNKGYAVACYRTLLQNLAQEGYIPSSCAEQTNTTSMKFHEKCGMRVSHECDYIEIANNWRS